MNLSNIPPDVSFIVEGRRFLLHRFPLMAYSNFFKSLLSGKYKEQYGDQIVIPDMSADIFAEYINLIYGREYVSSPALMMLVHIYDTNIVPMDTIHKGFDVPFEQFGDYINVILEIYNNNLSQTTIDIIASKMTSADYRTYLPDTIKQRVIWSKNSFYNGDKWDPLLKECLDAIVEQNKQGEPTEIKVFKSNKSIFSGFGGYIMMAGYSKEHALITYLQKYKIIQYRGITGLLSKMQPSIGEYHEVSGYKYIQENGNILIVKDISDSSPLNERAGLEYLYVNFPTDSLISNMSDIPNYEIDGLSNINVMRTDIFMGDVPVQASRHDNIFKGAIVVGMKNYIIVNINDVNVCLGKLSDDYDDKLLGLTDNEAEFVNLYFRARLIGPTVPITDGKLKSDQWITKTRWLIHDNITGVDFPSTASVRDYLRYQ